MPHLRLEVPEEWAREEWVHQLLDHLVETVAAMRMGEPPVPLINKSNLKHAIVPLHYAHVAGDTNKRFLHVTLAAGNDTPGRTAEVRSGAATKLGNEIDAFLAPLPVAASVASVTVWVQDIDRDRGYTTTAERRKAREKN